MLHQMRLYNSYNQSVDANFCAACRRPPAMNWHRFKVGGLKGPREGPVLEGVSGLGPTRPLQAQRPSSGGENTSKQNGTK